MKALILSDIHNGSSGKYPETDGVVRQANTEALATLKKLEPFFNMQEFDVVMHLGDVIRAGEDRKENKQNFESTYRVLNTLRFPSIHLVGNHELKAFSKQELSELYVQAQVPSTFYGVKEFPELYVVWLDADLETGEYAHISDECLRWLETQVAHFSDKPVLVFSHYSVVPLDATGSIYFASDPFGMYYHNTQRLFEILENTSVLAFVNGHVHLSTTAQVQIPGQAQVTPCVSVPAFSENIAAQEYPHNNPDVYSVLEVKAGTVIISSYTGKYCFSKAILH